MSEQSKPDWMVRYEEEQLEKQRKAARPGLLGWWSRFTQRIRAWTEDSGRNPALKGAALVLLIPVMGIVMPIVLGLGVVMLFFSWLAGMIGMGSTDHVSESRGIVRQIVRESGVPAVWAAAYTLPLWLVLGVMSGGQVFFWWLLVLAVEDERPRHIEDRAERVLISANYYGALGRLVGMRLVIPAVWAAVYSVPLWLMGLMDGWQTFLWWLALFFVEIQRASWRNQQRRDAERGQESV
jgi:hypothetical protein